MTWSWISFKFCPGNSLHAWHEAQSINAVYIISPDIEVRRKAIRIALEMVSSRNVQEVVLFLKKELSKTQDDAYEKVQLHECHRNEKPVFTAVT